MLELFPILVWVLSGFVVARSLGITGPLLALVSFPLGVAIGILLFLVQVTLPVPSWPLIALIAAAVAAAVVLVRDASRGCLLAQWRWLVVPAIVSAAVTVLMQVLPAIHWSTDSLFNLEISRLLVADEFGQVDWGAAERRQLAVPFVHGVSLQLGQGDYLAPLAPLLALSVLGLVWWLLRSRLSARHGYVADLIGVLGAFVVMSMNRFVFHAFYLNGHLLFATLLLVLVGLFWARLAAFDVGASPRALVFVPLLVAPAIVVTRPEGTLLLIIVAVALWASDRELGPPTWLSLVIGLATAVWNARLIVGELQRSGGAATSAMVMFALGLVMLALPIVARRLPRSALDRSTWLLESALWLALVAFAFRDPSVLINSALATGANLLLGAGGWGASFVVLAVVALVVVVAFRNNDDLILRVTLSAFIPLAMLLAYAREGAYRYGDGDSLNRLWMHVLPLLVVAVVQRVMTGSPRSVARSTERAGAPGALGN
ncbi:MAG: hypothetical protein KJ659_06135 [Actinobacteria bacterium]|nr:hypothetical protein [Actinomycetota bacterium]MBU1609338.1 hypothetical protein [Actinomycetota bacterium]MBU2314970.1 hypothetical protein [Actinomycetota bacterium]MBU2385064.1 hypothetical protein [Actinomycetota bacterium]